MKNKASFIRSFGIGIILLVCVGIRLFGDNVPSGAVSEVGLGPSEALRRSSVAACRELYNHLSYWKTDSIGFGDVKGLALQAACDIADPCTSLTVHDDYWQDRGHARGSGGGDPVRWGLLTAACATKKHVIDPAVSFTKDLVQGKMPAVFKLKGKLSGEVKKIPGILDGIIKAIDAIPKTFAMMYEKLGLNQPVLDEALERIAAAQKQVDQMLEKIKTDQKITPNLRKSLIAALTKLTVTLPKIKTVLSQLRSEIHSLIPLSLRAKRAKRAKRADESAAEYKIYTAEYNAYVAEHNKYIADTVKAAGIKQAQDIQKAVDEVKEAINRKVFFGKSLPKVVEAVGRGLENANL